MKKLVYLFLIIIILVPKQSKAQDGAAAAVGAAAVVGGIIGAAVSAENNRERLELIATNYILKNYPNLRGFSVKVLSHNSTTLKDLSGVKCVIFAFSEYETSMGDKLKNEVLLMFDSNSWINKYGTKTYKRIAVRLDRNKWNSLLKKYYVQAKQQRWYNTVHCIVADDRVQLGESVGSGFSDHVVGVTEPALDERDDFANIIENVVG